MILRKKIIKNHEKPKNGQNDHFLAVGKSAKIDQNPRPRSRNEFRGTPREGVSQRGPFFGSIFGQKGVIFGACFDPHLTAFYSQIWNIVVSEGVILGVQKHPFFGKCQK